MRNSDIKFKNFFFEKKKIKIIVYRHYVDVLQSLITSYEAEFS